MQMNLLRKVSLLEFRAASSMRENCTYGSMRGSRRKTAKSVLRVVEDRAGVPDKGRSALLYTLLVGFLHKSLGAPRDKGDFQTPLTFAT